MNREILSDPVADTEQPRCGLKRAALRATWVVSAQHWLSPITAAERDQRPRRRNGKAEAIPI